MYHFWHSQTENSIPIIPFNRIPLLKMHLQVHFVTINVKNTSVLVQRTLRMCNGIFYVNVDNYYSISFVATLHNAPKASPTLICISCAEMRRMKALTSQGCSSKWWTGIRDQSHSSALNVHCKKRSQVSMQPIENVWFSLQRSTLWVQTVNPTIFDND